MPDGHEANHGRQQAQVKPAAAAGLRIEVWTRFGERRERTATQELRNRLNAANDHTAALELLRQLQNRNVEGTGPTPVPGA